MPEPAQVVEDLERHPELPPGSEERFFGYGVMGLPFRSGHLLGLRRFAASSIGPPYRSVWHRDPSGRWTFCQDQSPQLACTRYFGAEVDEVVEGPIRIDWTGPRRFEVRAPAADLEWTMELASTPVTRLLNAVASSLTERAWRSERVLAVMSRVAGAALGAGSCATGRPGAERSTLHGQPVEDVGGKQRQGDHRGHRPGADRAGPRAGTPAGPCHPAARGIRHRARILHRLADLTSTSVASPAVGALAQPASAN
jgi:hypothetical protein